MRDLHIRLASLEQQVADLEKEAGLMDFAKDFFGIFDGSAVMKEALKGFQSDHYTRKFHWTLHEKDSVIEGLSTEASMVLTFKQGPELSKKPLNLEVELVCVPRGSNNKRLKITKKVIPVFFPEGANNKVIAANVVNVLAPAIKDAEATVMASILESGSMNPIKFASQARQTVRSLIASRMDKLAIIEKQDIVPPEFAMKLLSADGFEEDLLNLIEREFVFVTRVGNVIWIRNDDVALQLNAKAHGTNLELNAKAFTLNPVNPTKHDILATHTFEVVNTPNAVEEVAPQLVKFMAQTLEKKNQHSNAKKLKLASVFYNETMRNLARYTANNPMAKKAFLKGASASMGQTLQQPLRTRRDYGSY